MNGVVQVDPADRRPRPEVSAVDRVVPADLADRRPRRPGDPVNGVDPLVQADPVGLAVQVDRRLPHPQPDPAHPGKQAPATNRRLRRNPTVRHRLPRRHRSCLPSNPLAKQLPRRPSAAGEAPRQARPTVNPSHSATTAPTMHTGTVATPSSEKSRSRGRTPAPESTRRHSRVASEPT